VPAEDEEPDVAMGMREAVSGTVGEAVGAAAGNAVGAVTEPTFEEFVAARSQALLRSAYLLTGDAGKAEDLLQTALAKTWRHWDRANQSGHGEAYVRRVLYTTYASWWRRRWRGEVPTAELPEKSDTKDAYSQAAERATLMCALAELPRGQRAVLVLRFFEDRTEAETAKLLAISVGTVKSQTARALAQLRTLPTLTALIQEER
jgi:RNA polymerase sigma-70 factor (sigma-E family)